MILENSVSLWAQQLWNRLFPHEQSQKQASVETCKFTIQCRWFLLLPTIWNHVTCTSIYIWFIQYGFRLQHGAWYNKNQSNVTDVTLDMLHVYDFQFHFNTNLDNFVTMMPIYVTHLLVPIFAAHTSPKKYTQVLITPCTHLYFKNSVTISSVIGVILSISK